MFAVRAREKGLLFSVAVAPETPQRLRGDSGRLRQILINLAGNALKFTADGGIALRLDVGEDTEQEVLLRFSVLDSGIGIPASYRKSLFEKFTQLDPSITRKYGGSGLGLAISKELVRLMGGVIGVESPAPSFDRRASCSGKGDDAFLGGPGSEFWFEVRLEKTATALPAPTELDAAPATSGPGTLAASHARILLAEDSLTNRKVALAMLGRLGVAADVVSNGLEALEALETTRYDLILMDMQMPGMDGVEATERIRGEDSPSAYRRIPIIAMTACAMEGDRETCLAAGMDDYLSKPVTVAALRGMLEKWLPKDGASGSS